MRLAVIDIGTLTCRLLVASYRPDSRRMMRERSASGGAPDEFPANGSLDPVYTEQKIVWLGEGVDQTRRLRSAAMSRAIDAIREWKTVISRHGVERYAAVATSAVRHALNREEFVGRVKQATGVDVEVLDGEEEARRTCVGIRTGLPSEIRDVLGVDIGGGSTEFIVSRPGKPARVTSIEMGVVRLTERVLRGDPLRVTEIQEAETLIRELTRGALRTIGDVAGLTLVGTAGTITSLAVMAQALHAYDAARVRHYPLTLSAVRRIARDVVGATRADRAGMPGLEPGREAVIAAGALMLRGIMEELNRERCVVSDYGLREGVLMHLAAGRPRPGS